MIHALTLAAAVSVSPGQPAASRDDIVVTGERVMRPIRETASSVHVETAQSIDDRAAPDRVEQILQSVPNVQLGSGGEGPTIRGQDSTGVVRDLPAFLAGSRPRTTIRVDGRSISYYELAFGLTSIWDVERIEVFRSPQTTTQGRNSIGGAIFIETQDPGYAWSGRARLSAGDFRTRQAAAAVTAPLIDNQLALRLAGDLRRSRTSSRITSAAAGIDPNRDDSELVRLKVRAEPAPMPGFRLDLAYSHGRSQMPQIEGIEPPYKIRRDRNAGYGVFAVVVDALTARIAYSPAPTLDARLTTSIGEADVRRHAPKGLGEARIDTGDFTLEPIAVWRPTGSLVFTGGYNFTRVTLDQVIDLTALPQVQATGAFKDRQTSHGLFAEMQVQLAPDVGLTAGLRYQYDRQQRVGALTGRLRPLPVAYDRTFRAWLPKLALAWDVSPDIRLGVLAQRAANPGGLNLNTVSVRLEEFGAESLWDFELFARANLAGDRLALSANAFRYAMFNAQRTQTIVSPLPDGSTFTSSRVDNAPRAWTTGFEIEAKWRPSDTLAIGAAIGLLDTRITRTIAGSDPLLGKQFQRSPHFTGSASIGWQPFPAWRLTAQLRSHSRYYSDDRETLSRRIPGSATMDAKASWTRGALVISAYARNLFDAFNLTYKLANGIATAGDPREVGLSADWTF